MNVNISAILQGTITRGIRAAEVNETNGHLIFTLTDGTEVDMGLIYDPNWSVEEANRVAAETARVSAENARNVWEDYDSTKSYAAGNKVAYGGSSYLCIKPCTGIAPPNAEYWRLIASRGADGTGSMYFRGTTLVVKSGTLPPSGDYETYSGDYSVKVPFGGDDTVLETGNKLMRDNLTVEAVNVAETTNPAGGKTMIIGE